MKQRTRTYVLVVAVLLILIPLAAYVRLAAKDEKYSQTIARYECAADKCPADFDGDGRLGNVVIAETSAPPTGSYPAGKAWLVVSDSDRELLRLPYSYADNSLRTHVAIRPDSRGDRLLLFDHTRKGKAVRQAYAWNGSRMVQIEPSLADQEILAALSARDDAGSWNRWALFRTFAKPLLLGFYLLVVIAVFITLRLGKAGRNLNMDKVRENVSS